jgi:hypothetical protein
MTAAPPKLVRILHVPGCPLVDQLRTLLDDCIRHSGMRPVVETVSGSYPSPTMLINGIDVATGRPPTDQVCCRLDLPTSEQIVTALQKGPDEHRTKAPDARVAG